MTAPRWQYPPEFVAALPAFGLAPQATTPPSVVRDQLNDLYRFELRRMRDALRAGGIPQSEYVGLVIALRKRYWPLTLPLWAWEKICGAEARPAADGGERPR